MTNDDKLDKINAKLACECGLYHFMTVHIGDYYNYQNSTEWDKNIYEVIFELARSSRLKCDVKQDLTPLYRTDVELTISPIFRATLILLGYSTLILDNI